MLPGDKMVVIVMHKMLALVMIGNDPGCIRLVLAAFLIGDAIEQEVLIIFIMTYCCVFSEFLCLGVEFDLCYFNLCVLFCILSCIMHLDNHIMRAFGPNNLDNIFMSLIKKNEQRKSYEVLE